MNKKVLNNNIVFVYNETGKIANILTADVVKTEAVSAFVKLNPNPVQVLFDEIQTIFLPEAAVGVQIQKNGIIVSDQQVCEFEKKRTDELLRLAVNLNNKVSSSLIAYGFNLIYEISIDEQDNMLKKLSSKFAKNNIPKIDNRCMSIIPTILAKSEDNLITIAINPIRDVLGVITNKTRISTNVNYSNKIPELSELIDAYKKNENTISSYIDEVFKND